jgi:hypothetical protein
MVFRTDDMVRSMNMRPSSERAESAARATGTLLAELITRQLLHPSDLLDSSRNALPRKPEFHESQALRDRGAHAAQP